ncbi:MAG: hypothetical protein MZV63_25345 [Marinilabiliales bacterium]|nr:hypothetical protein [Marinilabiliales bacterium]
MILYNRMILLHVQDINHESKHIGSAGKGNTCNNIKTDPQTPWDILCEVCDCTETLPEPDDNTESKPRSIIGSEIILKGVRIFPLALVPLSRELDRLILRHYLCECTISGLSDFHLHSVFIVFSCFSQIPAEIAGQSTKIAGTL